jgi:MFS family permease
MASLGSGSFLGALSLAAASREAMLRRLIYAGAVTVSVMVLLLGFTHSFALAAVLAFVAGLGMIIYAASTNSFVQMLVPDQLRGRVMSVHAMLFAGATPIGALLIGGVMDLWGPAAGFLTGGSLGLLATLTVRLWARRLARPGGPAAEMITERRPAGWTPGPR